METLKIAAICMHCEAGEIQRNLERTESFVSRASAWGADLVCFPELSTTGYVLDDPLAVYSGLQPDAVIEKIGAMAGKQALVIMAGLIEKSEEKGRPYISHVVAGPDGLLGVYRKTHLSPKEKRRYRAGKEIRVFAYRGLTFGIQLCYEAHFPEISTVMALDGADILFMPHASPRGSPAAKLRSWLRHLPGRAFDNGLFVVACNQVGQSRHGFAFPGVAVALNPSGKVIAKYEGQREEMLLVELDQEEIARVRSHRMKYFIPGRRPELYGALTTLRPPGAGGGLGENEKGTKG